MKSKTTSSPFKEKGMANNSRRICEVIPENVCRTCLSREHLWPLFSEDHGQQNDMNITAVILAVTQLEIKKNDGLPEAICETCQQNVKLAYSFIIKSHEADSKLREQLQIPEKADSNFTDVKEEIDQDYSHWEEDIELASFNVDKSKLIEPITVVSEQVIEAEGGINNQNYCSLCKLMFNSERLFNKHMVENHPKEERSSPKKAKDLLKLSKKKEIQSKKKKVNCNKCFVCTKTFKFSKELIQHYDKDHNDTKVYRCNNCNGVYLDDETLKNHGICTKIDSTNDAVVDQGNAEKPYEPAYEILQLHSILAPGDKTNKSLQSVLLCLHCGCVLWSKSALKQHIDVRHSDKSLRCNICNKEFASLRRAQRHKLACDGTALVYRCHACGLEFSAELSLNKHILSRHVGASASTGFLNKKKVHQIDANLYTCEICDTSFLSKALLTSHIRKHNKNYECEICKRKFKGMYNLWSHKRVHDKQAERVVEGHARPKLCLCTYCGQGFSNSSNLIVHVRRHTGEKPYKCDFCDKAFPRSYDLAVHRRSHTGERPCPCPICGKSFSRSNKLTRHMHTHTGQKPYKCTYCDKGFAQSNDLRVHIRRHTGDKPYVCEMCGDRFIHGSALQNHRRSQGHYPPSTSILPPSGYLPLKTQSLDSNLPATLTLHS